MEGGCGSWWLRGLDVLAVYLFVLNRNHSAPENVNWFVDRLCERMSSRRSRG